LEAEFLNVRYFAAARAAAGVEEEQFELPAGATVDALLEAVLAVSRPEPPAGTPPLPRILSRSSFLLNEVAVRDRTVALAPGDVVDVLPPFAGG
jgi:molybdopterin converting factor small subunit